jgi:sulfur transfer complex TusBCD TusB component (DsrH family)
MKTLYSWFIMNLTIESFSSSICRRSDNILLLTKRFFSHHWCCMWSRNFWTIVLNLFFVSVISIYRFQCSTLRDFIIYIIIIAFLITIRKFLFICIFFKLRCFHVDWFVRILLISLRYKMSFASIFIFVVILRMRFFICFSINFSYLKICVRSSVSSLLHNDFHSEINNCFFVNAEKVWNCVWLSNDIIDVLINIKIWIWWFRWKRSKWRSRLKRYWNHVELKLLSFIHKHKCHQSANFTFWTKVAFLREFHKMSREIDDLDNFIMNDIHRHVFRIKKRKSVFKQQTYVQCDVWKLVVIDVFSKQKISSKKSRLIHQKISNLTSVNRKISNLTLAYEELFNLFLTHEEFFNLIFAHEEFFNICSAHQKLLNLSSAHQKRLNFTSTHQVLSNDTEWNASQLNNEIDDEDLISNIENELSKDFFFSTFINQRDLQKANIENVNSANIVKEHASLTFEYKKKDCFEISSCSIKKEMSNFCLAFELWCDTKKIKKNTYNSLFEVLHLLNSSEMRKLFRRLNTLHIWCKRKLSLFLIQKIVIAVKKTKQFTRIRKSDEFNIYFFDLRILIVTILSSTWTDVLHTNMTNIVDKSSEYWHLNAWDSFI